MINKNFPGIFWHWLTLCGLVKMVSCITQRCSYSYYYYYINCNVYVNTHEVRHCNLHLNVEFTK